MSKYTISLTCQRVQLLSRLRHSTMVQACPRMPSFFYPCTTAVRSYGYGPDIPLRISRSMRSTPGSATEGVPWAQPCLPDAGTQPGKASKSLSFPPVPRTPCLPDIAKAAPSYVRVQSFLYLKMLVRCWRRRKVLCGGQLGTWRRSLNRGQRRGALLTVWWIAALCSVAQRYVVKDNVYELRY